MMVYLVLNECFRSFVIIPRGMLFFFVRYQMYIWFFFFFFFFFFCECSFSLIILSDSPLQLHWNLWSQPSIIE